MTVISACKLKSQLRQAEREIKRAEREAKKAEREIKKGYDTLLNAWIHYLNALDAAGYDVDGMEDKALIFVEVVLDAESREANSLKS